MPPIGHGGSTSTSDDDDAATYDPLVLGPGAAGVIQSEEEEEAELAKITGPEQRIGGLQGEFDFSVGIKGMKRDVANGGANPTDDALGTGTNWDRAGVNGKSLSGVCIKIATKG